MKELSIKQKAKAYDEALNVLHKYDGANIMFTQDLKEEMFPELKESEDERVRKVLLDYFKDYKTQEEISKSLSTFFGIPTNDILAWLEKQGEQIVIANKEYWRGYREGKKEILDKYAELEKQGEQKPTIEMKSPEESLSIDSDTYNKIVDECIYGEQKPKFRIGDTIKKESTGDIVTISEIDLKNREYRLSNTGFIPFKYEYLWELVEQKPAEEISSNPNYISPKDKALFKIATVLSQHEDKNGSPLEEIRSILVDYGINNLEANEQKPAWSEEDDDMYIKVETAIDSYYAPFSRDAEEMSEWFKNLKSRVQPQPKQEWSEEVQEEPVSEEFINTLGAMLNDGLPDRYLVSEERIKKSAELLFSIACKQLKNEKQEWSEEDESWFKELELMALSFSDDDSYRKRFFNWLKSIKNRYTWKPSEEQMKALNTCIMQGEISYVGQGTELQSIYNDLKKLTE